LSDINKQIARAEGKLRKISKQDEDSFMSNYFTSQKRNLICRKSAAKDKKEFGDSADTQMAVDK